MTFILLLMLAILFGIVEAITEWLPVSSTGHLIILEDIFPVTKSFERVGFENFGSDFWSMFLVVIQFGAIIAVIIYFFNKLWPFSKNKSKEEKKDVWNTWLKTLIACVPAAIIGLLFDDQIDQYFFNKLTVSITLIIYGILFIILEIYNKNRTLSIDSVKKMTIKNAIIIGCIQLLALIPGTSRSGVTILGAMLIGCSRETSAEFSFFLSIPVMVGASLLKIVKFFLTYHYLTFEETSFLLVGIVSSFIFSLFVVKWLMNFVKKHDFKIFGYYRIALGIVVLILFLFRI